MTPWTVAHQALLLMGFPRQEYWLLFPSLGDIPDPGIEPRSPALQADFLLTELCELPDVQADFRKGRGTRDQIVNIHWIMEKAREFQ